MRMSSAGNALAAGRALSGFSAVAKLTDEISGISYYQFLKDLEENFEAKAGEIQEKCSILLQQVFRPEHLLVSSTGDAQAYAQVEKYLPGIRGALFTTPFTEVENPVVLEPKKEGFRDASQVQYVCRAGNFVKAGYEYSGYLKILKVILSYDYFWINIRVKGGAYGCRSTFATTGDMFFVSFRDPNLDKTNQVFAETPEYIHDFDVDERDMTKYIIGTVSEMDTPLTPSQRGIRALSAYMTDTTLAEVQKYRDQVLTATAEDIRNLEPLVRDTLAQGYFCVVGNEDVLDASKDMFDELKDLY
jgi:hypothetical protein